MSYVTEQSQGQWMYGCLHARTADMGLAVDVKNHRVLGRNRHAAGLRHRHAGNLRDGSPKEFRGLNEDAPWRAVIDHNDIELAIVELGLGSD
jgi:hypothetical protein